MKKKLRDTDFLYLSARIRGLENRLLGKEALEKLLDCRSYDEALETAASLYGYEAERLDADELLLYENEKTYEEVEEMTRNSFGMTFEVTLPFRYIYDCQNLKTLIKADALGTDASLAVVPFGTVSPEDAASAVRDRAFGVFPKHLAKAAEEAREKLLTSRDPREASVMLDKAVFADVFEKCEEIGLPLLTDAFRMKADFANVGIFLRLVSSGVSLDEMMKSLVPAGDLPESFFSESFQGGKEKLLEKLNDTRYSSAAEKIAESGKTLSEIESIFDGFYMERMQSAKMVPFGPEVSVGYLAAKENEIKNVRLVLSCMEAGIPADRIRERLRASF